jgi:hypothetical protein
MGIFSALQILPGTSPANIEAVLRNRENFEKPRSTSSFVKFKQKAERAKSPIQIQGVAAVKPRGRTAARKTTVVNEKSKTVYPNFFFPACPE